MDLGIFGYRYYRTFVRGVKGFGDWVGEIRVPVINCSGLQERSDYDGRQDSDVQLGIAFLGIPQEWKLGLRGFGCYSVELWKLNDSFL